MNVTKCNLDGILLIEPKIFVDQRGFFRETYELERYMSAGVADEFVQDNHSRSYKNVLRGMHYTKQNTQSQLLTVISGAIFDVVVDIRRDSESFGKWFGAELISGGICQIFMPPGFAHGFCVLSDYADLHYKVSQSYDPLNEAGLRWDDTEVGIQWPIKNPIMSSRDKLHPLLRQIDSSI